MVPEKEPLQRLPSTTDVRPERGVVSGEVAGPRDAASAIAAIESLVNREAAPRERQPQVVVAVELVREAREELGRRLDY